MDGDICPPYWPELIWRLLHHPGTPPPPPWEELFLVIAIDQLAAALPNRELGARVREVTMPALREVTAGLGK